MSPGSKQPYIIYRNPPGWGFWSNFTIVLQALDYADLNDFAPVVDMERHITRYNEDDDSALGTKNAWEYYFEQPAGLSVAEALRLDPNPPDNQSRDFGRFIHVQNIEPPSDVLARARQLVARYVRIKPNVLAEADSILQPGVHSDILGIHVRGTDMRKANATGHVVPATDDAYLEQALALDRKHSFSRIFLACDEIETVSLFTEHFGERLMTSKAHRTSAAAPVSLDYQWLFRPQRQLHRYLLGLEVLVDTLLLARCGHLLCGISNVSHCAMYFSNERQTIHPVPPVWIRAKHKEPSWAHSFLDIWPKPYVPLSPAVLRGHAQQLQRLLEETVNSRTEAQQLVNDLQRKNESGEDIPTHVGLLKSRIDHLVNRWTWLGWRLMPWTKPSWRHHPLDV